MKRTMQILTVCALLPVCGNLTGCRAARVVQWPDLKQLDNLAERCEALCDAKDVAALRQIAGTVQVAAVAVVRDPVPAGARQPAEVKTLQGDLKSLADAIHDPARQDGAELTAILAGVHPIVAKLMEAAGMPHVHELPKPTPQAGQAGHS
jgi:hypothetical protein